MPVDQPSSFENIQTRYVVEREVGRGGAGRVFLAYDGNLGREVAVKEIDVSRALNDEQRERKRRRFVREAKITGMLEHPGVVPVYDFGAAPDGGAYYVMKYVRGHTLTHVIASSKVRSPEEGLAQRLKVLNCLIDVCEAVAYAHAKKIIHRDLKPGNIVLGEFGETIILDWGLAKRIGEVDSLAEEPDEGAEEPEDEALTRQGAVIGTPSYMAPEQADHRFGAVDEQSDVYALGALLFIILTGERIYEPGGSRALERLATDDPTPSPRERMSGLPPELVAICEKATAKQKHNRFRDAREMAGELRAYRDGRLVSVYAYSRGELFRRFLIRNKAAAALAAALILAVLVGGGFSLNYAVEAHRARRQAERALVDISEISQRAMALARGSVETIAPYVERFSHDMKGAADRLARIPLDDASRIMPVLEKLSEDLAGVSSFAVIRPSLEVAASLPEDFARFLDRSVLIGERVDKVFEARSVLLGNAMVIDGSYMFAVSVPIMRGGSAAAALTSFIKISDIMPAAFGFNPADSPFQVWCMQDDGYILYDADPAQIGKELFHDEMYRKFPELLQFGKRMQAEPWGMGYYSFYERKGGPVIYKIAAWDTVSLSKDVSWKMIVTHPYVVTR